MSAPYYQDEHATLYHGDALPALAAMADRSVDCVITDPPFDARTHDNTRSNRNGYGTSGNGNGNRTLSGGSDVRFDAFTHENQLALFAELGRIARRWVVANLSTHTAFRFEVGPPPAGLQVLRVGAWVKTNPMPIISADRPAMGWEAIAYMHREDAKPSWNGGGRAGNYVLPTSQGSGHPTQKPIEMVRDWVRRFTNPGDVILDPFAGTGTTLRAALDEGRKVIAYEIDERWCEHAAGRLSQGVLDLGGIA
ncbi:DNA-methyltransferase [Pseudactinotalea sp. Z1748]|uniref:DNA-methyltransferase n=1 Tax=Pseudactinotalea sp. Z1748 TaxID=3413027 RepID=UPI003C7A7C34